MTENLSEVGSYLKRIGQIPLLKPDEEIELGKQVKRMMTCNCSPQQESLIEKQYKQHQLRNKKTDLVG